MEFKTKEIKDGEVYYFGNEDKSSISIIECDPSIRFLCDMCQGNFHIFTAVWYNKLDIDFFKNAELEKVTKGAKTGIRCLKCSEKYLEEQYKVFIDILENEKGPRRLTAIKTLANIKAAQLLIKWFKENFSDKYYK